MNDNKTTSRPELQSGAGTIILGLDLGDPILSTLALPLSNAISGDCDQLGAENLRAMSIGYVICGLFAAKGGPQNDAISVLDALSAAGFSGEVVVLAPPLLRPKMVENELRGLSRGMRMRLIHGVLPPLDTI